MLTRLLIYSDPIETSSVLTGVLRPVAKVLDSPKIAVHRNSTKLFYSIFLRSETTWKYSWRENAWKWYPCRKALRLIHPDQIFNQYIF